MITSGAGFYRQLYDVETFRKGKWEIMRSHQKHKRIRKNKLTSLKHQKGFTLIEVLFAVAVLAFGILAVSSLQGSAMNGNLISIHRTEAVTWAQTQMETLLALTYNQLLAGVTPQVIQGNYTINRAVANGPVPNTLQITVTVTYQERGIARRAAELICVKSSV